MKHKQIKNIQGLRGIAALLVCIMHIVSDQPSSDQWIIISKHIMQSIGHFGVDLFFTISGFIIAWIVMKESKLASLRSGVSFIIKRFFRIYPLFWFTLLFMFCLSIFNNGLVTDEAHQAMRYPVIFLLTPTIPLQYSAWTLCFELYFYAVVFIFICLCQRKYFMFFFTAWALFHFVMIGLNLHHLLSKPLQFLGHYQIVEFYFGLSVGYFLYHFNKYIFDKYIAIILGLILFFTYSVIIYKDLQVSTWIAILLQGGAACLFVYGMVGLEQHSQFNVPIVLQRLGNISYSIYLWAFPVLGIVTHINHEFMFWGYISPSLRSVIEIGIVVLISFASYYWIERPCIRLSHKIVNLIK